MLMQAEPVDVTTDARTRVVSIRGLDTLHAQVFDPGSARNATTFALRVGMDPLQLVEPPAGAANIGASASAVNATVTGYLFAALVCTDAGAGSGEVVVTMSGQKAV